MFAISFADWLRSRQAEADARAAGSLSVQLGAAEARAEMAADGKAIDAGVVAMTDDQARAEALKWATKV